MAQFDRQEPPAVPPRTGPTSNQRYTTDTAPSAYSNTHPMFFSSPQYPFYGSVPFANNTFYPQNSLGYRNGMFGSGSNNGTVPGIHMLAGIENFVSTVNSLAALFESSYLALTNSLRALLSAGDQLANLRLELWNILRAVSLIKGVKWLVKRLLVFFRLAKAPTPSEMAWSEGRRLSSNTRGSETGASVNTPTNYSGLMFLAFVIGGPWLLYKVIKSSLHQEAAKKKEWMEERGPHYVARATFDFSPANSDEVRLEKGQKVIVATSRDYVGWDVPKEWLLVSTDGKTSGLAPGSYLQLVQDNSRKHSMETNGSYPQNRNIGINSGGLSNGTKLNFDDKFEIM